MKIVLAILFIVQVAIGSDTSIDAVDIKITGILHNEVEQMSGRSGDETLPSQTNSYSSLYAHLLVNYDFNENIFVSFGTKGNIVFGEDTYTIPMYLRGKMTSDNINKAIVSEASINYDNGFFSLNAGRQNVNYDWLLGSIDGVLAMIGSDEEISLRFFWFENYVNLQYNYYSKINNINDNKGMYGAVAKVNKNEFEFSLFNYYVQDLRNILGGHINYIHNNLGINISYTSAIALDLALYDYDESFLNGSIEMLYNQHYIEVGFSKTGENGLLAMIQMGSFMFGQFYLSNQVDREGSLNGFLKYIHANNRWRFELIGGVSRYDNSFIEIQKALISKEIDLYVKYKFNNNFSVDLGAMIMDVDERDPLQVDQSLIMLNMVFNYENY